MRALPLPTRFGPVCGAHRAQLGTDIIWNTIGGP